METIIKIDSKKYTCSIEITDLPIEHVSTLSKLSEAIVGQFLETLRISGVKDEFILPLQKPMLDGTITKFEISQAISLGRQFPRNLKNPQSQHDA